MNITLDISYYPLQEDFIAPIDAFIESLRDKGINVEVGKMSTSMVGDYDLIMSQLKDSMGEFMAQYPSVFNLKITNYVQ